jgi:hypothetical protein
MKIEQIIRLLAGILILIGIILGFYMNQYWYLLVIFVALNFIQSAITGFCGMEKILIKLGFQK